MLKKIELQVLLFAYNIISIHYMLHILRGISNMEIQVDIQDDTSLHILIKKLKQQINVLTVECYDLVDNGA